MATEATLERPARKQNLARYEIVDLGNGWEGLRVTYAGNNTYLKEGMVCLRNEEFGMRGDCPDLETAQAFVADHSQDDTAYYHSPT